MTFLEAILGAQDLNADGYDDILVGAHRYDNVGAVYVYGPLSGTMTSPQEYGIWGLKRRYWCPGLNSDFGRTIALSDINGNGTDIMWARAI